MATSQVNGLDPVTAVAAIGVLGVGAQWIAWRLRIPAIVLMLLMGVIAGPVTGVVDPKAALGDLMGPIISIAVAVILFEGGLTLNFHSLRDAAQGVRRLVFVGAPLGWLLSTAALYYGAGLGLAASAVFGGILIVTGPTVIAPLLRQAKLARRPASLLQWEAIVNDPIGALAAVLAFEFVLVQSLTTSVEHAAMTFVLGIGVAAVLGYVAGRGLAVSFRNGWVPEYMKVPVLFVVLIAIFAISNTVLHESGLLTVTVMGIVIANAELPSYEELRRFKEHATVLLVSGVFILLAASLDFSSLALLDVRAVVFVASIVLIARPLTVHLSLLGSDVPMTERWLVALTAPRGVVLVAVAGLFGERLTELGYQDGAVIGPLAFVLVASTVVLHGFTLKPIASLLGLAAKSRPGVLVVGGTSFGTALAQALNKAEVPVLLADTNYRNLRAAKDAGVGVFFGDILSEAAEHHLELHNFEHLIAVTDNEAYNTLVTTDLGPEFGRNNVMQFVREKEGFARYDLPSTLGGRGFGGGRSYADSLQKIRDGWEFRTTRIGAEFSFDTWKEEHPEARIIAIIPETGSLRFPADRDAAKVGEGERILHFSPPRPAKQSVTD